MRDRKAGIVSLAIGALGVVFGDIGTSPLYTLGECVYGEHGSGVVHDNVLGVLSLIVWGLTLVVAVKYLGFIMRADNHGEGGILALLALIPTKRNARTAKLGLLAVLVVIGAALLYGDGVITPAISVLSAVEGLAIVKPTLASSAKWIACGVLVILFSVQRFGTGGIGRFFGPVMVVWFIVIGALGGYHVAHHPGVLVALSPYYGVHYITTHGFEGFAILGGVVLAVTGGEALYADMGHFGARPIRLGWFVLAMPTLLLSYLGQGALVLGATEKLDSPFFAQVSGAPATYALVGLSTLATVIASQALISGVFSLTHQAIALGLFPRVTIKHTSDEAEGQIYVPEMNWALMIGCLLLVIILGSSARLAAAYGIAVSGTMGITSVIYFAVTRRTWKWPLIASLPVLLLFLSFDLPFFAANLIKFKDGGYIPIMIAVVISIVMFVWQRGRRLLFKHYAKQSPPLEKFVSEVDGKILARVPGTAVFLARAAEGVPPALHQYATRFRVMHEHIVLLTVITEHQPYVRDLKERVQIEPVFDVQMCKTHEVARGFFRATIHVGFMETPNVPRLMRIAKERGDLPIEIDDITYVLGRERLLATDAGDMGRYSESLFSFLSRNARSAADYFSLPPDQVIELGTQVDL